jgi:nitrogen regulatory protein PII-like uncharacterized protein
VPADIIAIIVFFAISGIVGAGILGLLAYKMRLASKLEWARVHAAEDVPEQALEQIQDLQEQVERLTERVDFTEKLLDAGRKGVRELSEPSAELE